MHSYQETPLVPLWEGLHAHFYLQLFPSKSQCRCRTKTPTAWSNHPILQLHMLCNYDRTQGLSHGKFWRCGTGSCWTCLAQPHSSQGAEIKTNIVTKGHRRFFAGKCTPSPGPGCTNAKVGSTLNFKFSDDTLSLKVQWKETYFNIGDFPFTTIVAYRNSDHLSSADTCKGIFSGFCNGREASPRAASKRDTKAGSDSSDFMMSVDDGAETENWNHQSILQNHNNLTHTTISDSTWRGSLIWWVQFINFPSKHQTLLQQGSLGLWTTEGALEDWNQKVIVTHKESV